MTNILREICLDEVACMYTNPKFTCLDALTWIEYYLAVYIPLAALSMYLAMDVHALCTILAELTTYYQRNKIEHLTYYGYPP